MGQAFHLAQHFFDTGSYVLAILAQLHQFAMHGLVLFLPLLKLLPQPFQVALGRCARLLGGLVQLNGAIDFLFQRLKIFSRNLRQIPLPRFSQTWADSLSEKYFSR